MSRERPVSDLQIDNKSPWQRGSNENANGPVRRYFPRRVDLTGVDRNALDAIARELNGRPRRTLGWMTPSEAYAAAVAMTT